MCLEKISGQRGSTILIVENYMHNFDRVHQGIQKWRCRNRKCSGSVFIKDDDYIDFVSHNHQPELSKIETLKFNLQIKSKAAVSRDRSNNIVSDAIRSVEEESLKNIIKTSSLKKIINRERKKQITFRVKEFNDIPEILQFDSKGNKFLIHDSGMNDKNRIVIFSSSFKRKFIEKSCTFIIDGTFKVTPKDYYQLFIIHIYIFGKSFPGFYILMKNKTEVSYNYVFTYLKNEFSLEPKNFLIDFEKAVFNSLRYNFFSGNIFFCYFHYSQSIWRKISELGFRRIYFSNISFKKIIKMILVLPFFPENKIELAYKFILNQCALELKNLNLQSFLKYFENTFFGNLSERKESIFSKSNWNVFERVIMSLPRTTNNAEAFHRAFAQKCVVSHPNISVVIMAMLDEEEINKADLINIKMNGSDLTRKNLLKEEQMRLLLINNDLFTMEEFFERILKIV